MAKTISKFLITVLLFLSFDMVAQPNLLITEINFSGNKSISSSTLSDQMFHSATNWLQRSIFNAEESYYDEKIFQEDLQNVIRYYQKKGFLKVSISDIKLDENFESKKIAITVFINENLPTKVNKSKIIISHHNDLTESFKDSVILTIENSLSLNKDKIFEDQKIFADENILLNTFLDLGFPHAKISYQLQVDEKNDLVDITWNVDTGPRSYFSEINIEGYNRSSEPRIRNLLSFKNGDLYSNAMILESQQRIYNQGFYYVASFLANKGDTRTTTEIPIRLTLKEAPLLRADFGLGYGRDEKFRISANFRILGPWGTPSRISVEAKHSALDALKLSLIYTNTDVFLTQTTFRIKSSFRRQTEPAFEAERKGIDFALMREIFWGVYASVMTNFERVNMDSLSISYVNRVEGFVPDYNKTGLILGFNKNESSPLFNPENGFQFSYVHSFMGLTKNEPYNYIINQFELRKYFLLVPNRLVFAYKFNIGAITSFDDHKFVPIEDKFFSGGSNSIRGWGRSELGPLDNNNKPIGGKSILENSIEFRYKLTPELGSVLFMDFGNVWLDEHFYKINNMRYAAGLGFRYSTPIGPIRFDVAHPIFESKGKSQFWFSIGQAF